MSTHAGAAPLIRVKRRGRFAALGVLLGREFAEWWRTRLWWVNALVWVVLFNGVTTVIMFSEPSLAGNALLDEVTRTLMQMAGVAVPIGVVIVVQGAIVGERELGTAAWIMSKPASRNAFVLAKLAAHVTGFVATAVVVPAVILVVEAGAVLGRAPSVVLVAAGGCIITLAIVAYVALTLALGTIFSGRGPVAGIGIGVVLAGVFLSGLLPTQVVLVMPWRLGEVAATVSIGGALETTSLVPVAGTAVAAVVLTVVALRRFARLEL